MMRQAIDAARRLLRRVWCVARHPRAIYLWDVNLLEWRCTRCGAVHGA